MNTPIRVMCFDTTRPSFNLALEYTLFQHSDAPCLCFWRNERSVIVGKNQNTLAEVDYDYVTAHHIPVVRRHTGGGAVFHDLGNVNYTVIERGSREHFNDYAVFTRPVIDALRALGVPAELSGRNDILADGKKVSGNAQCADEHGVLHHGTLLFSADLSELGAALKSNPLKIQSKGIASVRSRVGNIADYLDRPLSAEEFMRVLYRAMLALPDAVASAPTAEELAIAAEWERTRYGTWDWTFGFAQPYAFLREGRFACGCVAVSLDIADNTVRGATVSGDFFGAEDVHRLECALVGLPYAPDAFAAADLPVERCIAGLSKEEFLSLLF